MIETTDFNKSELYTLSIRLSTDGFSFSVFNPQGQEQADILNREVNESLSFTANLKQTFRELDWLKRPFRRINVLIADNRYTLIPLEFFEDEQAETVFYHNHTKRENETVQYNILPKSNVVVLFGIDKSVCAFLHEQYPDPKFFSQSSPLIEYFGEKSRTRNDRKLYAHLRREAIDVYAFEHGRLLLANTFACKETSDRLYYLLYIWKQLGFDQEHDELHLTGNLDDKEALLTELQKFIRHAFVMNPASNLDLQAITLCE